VNNIDWPSKPGLPAERQRAEMRAILDRAHALKLNAIIFQVRPAADALYASALEPWSEYLTGVQGRAPGYDPLGEWVAEAHRRGLELHAWFNPYRARHQEAKSDFAPTHLAKTHPESVKKYGDLWWMDPGDAFAVQHTLDVVADVVRRYDVDGVHIDDYFYPYPIAAPAAQASRLHETPKQAGTPALLSPANLDFPDEPSWNLYRAGGGKLARADWRRQNVNHLVEELYLTVHRVKPWVKFGISPFGLGRPDRRPRGVEGFSQYDQLYADVELWVRKGWYDYLTPQLYWKRHDKKRPFAVLLDYWARQVHGRRHLWPGLFTSSINDTPKSWSAGDITREIDAARANHAASGQVHFSMIALMQDRRGIGTALQTGAYAEAALVPASPWLGATPPPAPRLERGTDGRVTIRVGAPLDGARGRRQAPPLQESQIERPHSEAVAWFAIWRRQGGAWNFSVQPVCESVADVRGVDAMVVSAVDRLGNESRRVTLQLPASL
jgi:uncharacterized lipoprotein YddW (UPF0748 family)